MTECIHICNISNKRAFSHIHEIILAECSKLFPNLLIKRDCFVATVRIRNNCQVLVLAGTLLNILKACDFNSIIPIILLGYYIISTFLRRIELKYKKIW